MKLNYTKSIKLNTNSLMPNIGIGTFGIKCPDVLEQVLDVSLETGYRLIDTAACYKNEHLIGECLPKLLVKHNLKREDVFITTKLAPKDLDSKLAVKAFEQSMSNLKTDYIDLYLIHWPGRRGKKVADPQNEEFRKNAWKALEKIYLDTKKIRNLGVSNFTKKHLMQMKEYSSVVPAVNQCELHPDYLNQDVMDYCKVNEIHYQAYSSLGQGSLVSDDRMKGLMKNFPNKTAAQVLLKWGLQQGCSVLPKSTNPKHIIENFDVNNFELTPSDIITIKNHIYANKKYAWSPQLVA